MAKPSHSIEKGPLTSLGGLAIMQSSQEVKTKWSLGSRDGVSQTGKRRGDNMKTVSKAWSFMAKVYLLKIQVDGVLGMRYASH